MRWVAPGAVVLPISLCLSFLAGLRTTGGRRWCTDSVWSRAHHDVYPRLAERLEATCAGDSGHAGSFSGLLGLLAPSGISPSPATASLMVAAGIAWGCYSVLGKRSLSPARDTAGNFLRSLPWITVAAAMAFVQSNLHITLTGAFYATVSGALASAAGYMVWYAVVKRLQAQTAATLQLSVPVLAAVAGVLLLNEPLSPPMLLASLIVLSGITFALTRSNKAAR